MVLWNFLHKKFPPSAQDKKTILPPQAVPLPLQGRLNVSLRDSTHLNYLSQNVTFSHLLFGRVSLGRRNNFLDTVYSLFTTHRSLIHNDKDFSRFTSHFSRFYISSIFVIMDLYKKIEPIRFYFFNLFMKNT